jgi:hypothetical protein
MAPAQSRSKRDQAATATTVGIGMAVRKFVHARSQSIEEDVGRRSRRARILARNFIVDGGAAEVALRRGGAWTGAGGDRTI